MSSVDSFASEFGVFSTAVMSYVVESGYVPGEVDDEAFRDGFRAWLERGEDARREIVASLDKFSGDDVVAEALDCGVEVSVVKELTGHSDRELEMI